MTYVVRYDPWELTVHFDGKVEPDASVFVPAHACVTSAVVIVNGFNAQNPVLVGHVESGV